MSTLKTPSSTETEQKPLEESVSAPPNQGNVLCAQPVIDAGHDSGPGHWEGECQNVAFISEKQKQ